MLLSACRTTDALTYIFHDFCRHTDIVLHRSLSRSDSIQLRRYVFKCLFLFGLHVH